MADILDKIPVDAEMTIFKIEVEPNKLNACIDDILRRLTNLEGGEMDGWISVKDRLPDEGEGVLVCTVVGAIYIAARYNDEFLVEVTESPINGTVMYWQPLPEPPWDGDEE